MQFWISLCCFRLSFWFPSKFRSNCHGVYPVTEGSTSGGAGEPTTPFSHWWLMFTFFKCWSPYRNLSRHFAHFVRATLLETGTANVPTHLTVHILDPAKPFQKLKSTGSRAVPPWTVHLGKHPTWLPNGLPVIQATDSRALERAFVKDNISYLKAKVQPLRVQDPGAGPPEVESQIHCHLT